MKETRVIKPNIAIRVALILLALTCLSVWFTAGMLARYTTQDSGSDGARVAKFVFNVNDKDASRIIDVTGVKKPGDVQTYTFVVKNNTANVSEVAEDVIITLSLNGSMPLVCKIKENTTEMSSVTANGGDVPVTNTTSVANFSASVSTNKEYILHVEWPASRSDTEYSCAATIAKLVMTVTGRQID